MPVEGRIICRLTANGITSQIDALVTPCIEEDILVSWGDLQNMSIIPRGFPNTVMARAVSQETTAQAEEGGWTRVERKKKKTKKEKTPLENQSTDEVKPIKEIESPGEVAEILLLEFSDVLNDELSEKPMNADRMKIKLKPGYKPKKVTTARRVPLRFEKEAKAVIKDLIKKKVIIEVTELTEWCSPAFFVPKADGKRVRLVTDFTNLNEWVERPVHLFPSTKEIIQAVTKEGKVFCKLDAVHGYFQLGIHEDSSKLTTFLLQQGKYKYLRAPMGLNASSDEWCKRRNNSTSGRA